MTSKNLMMLLKIWGCSAPPNTPKITPMDQTILHSIGRFAKNGRHLGVVFIFWTLYVLIQNLIFEICNYY